MSSRRSRQSRNRRSRGRKKQSQAVGKWLGYGALLVGALLVIGLIVGYNAVRSYLRSDDFRVMLGKRAGSLLEGKGNFSPFQWDGWSVSTEEFSFEGADGVRKFQARGLDGEVDIGAVWSKTYRLENIRLREFEFHGDFRDGVNGSGEIDVWESEPNGFWSDFLPDNVEVSGVDVASVSGSARTDEGDWEWANTSARVTPGSGSEVFDLQLNGGKITTPIALVDELSLKSVGGRFSGQHFYLLNSEFDVLKEGRITAVGDFDLEGGEWKIDGSLSGARVEELVAEDWKQRLMGPIVSTFKVSGQPGREVVASGDLKITDGVLTALPVLDRIAAYSNSLRFRRLVLSEASLKFEKRGDLLNLREIVLASEGLVRVEGEMTIDGRLIRRGDFRVGITPGTLAHLPGAETKVFQRGELGLLWSPMTVSGTLDAPQEDLSKRLIAAAGERMFEMIPETGQFALKYSGEVIGESTRRMLSDEGIVLGTGRAILNQVNRVIGRGTEGDPKDVPDNGAEEEEEGPGLVDDAIDQLFDIFGRPIKK